MTKYVFDATEQDGTRCTYVFCTKELAENRHKRAKELFKAVSDLKTFEDTIHSAEGGN